MIKKIRIQNCFRHPDTTIEFKEGLTGIFGANEAGKSLIFEMIAYALFGSVALRGSAPDYKKLIVTMDFVVAGTSYQVMRAGSKALLYRSGVELVSGQKPINSEIIRILGYDYKVYCVANYSPQGELCNLSRMKPAERKSMVDNVIGLGIIDKVITSIANRVRDLNGKIEGMDMALIEPIQPERPENYRLSSDVQKDMVEVNKKVQEFNYANTWLTQPPKIEPVLPVKPNLISLEKIEQEQSAINETSSRLREINAQLIGYVPATFSSDQLQKYKQDWTKIHRRNELNMQKNKFIAEPKYDIKTLDEFMKQSENAQRWKLKQQLEAHGKNECPNCHHTWFLQAENLKEVADTVETYPPAYIPNAFDYNNIKLYEVQKEERIRLEAELEELNKVDLPPLSMSEIEQQLSGIENEAKFKLLQTEQKKLQEWLAKPQPPYSDMIQQWKTYENNYNSYINQVKIYDEWKIQHSNYSKVREDLQHYPAAYTILAEEQQRCYIYENEWKNYTTARDQWIEKSELVNEMRFELTEMEKAREAMRGLRLSIKKFLVPSLNRVASHLLAQMTGGSRNIVDINEEFEITVDGQAINTLSGSGQAVANLAIRIALGQVLIAKKFPVFLADEIDGDMDEERAGYTAECIRRITKHVPQFLLISHKRPLADNYLELGR